MKIQTTTFLLILILALLYAAGCGDDSRGCGVENCQGCCGVGDVCMPGTDPTACGKGGKDCIVCDADMLCINGQCGTSDICGPCTGCCAEVDKDNKLECVPGNTLDACGHGGGYCEQCNFDENCIDKVCRLVTLESFTPETYAVRAYASDEEGDNNIYISISDIKGNSGCALAESPSACPAENGHQVFVIVYNAYDRSEDQCIPGYYNVHLNCNPTSKCTYCQYRKWEGGSALESIAAGSGVVTVSQSSNCGGSCEFDIIVGFGQSGTYTANFSIQSSGTRPWCNQCV